MIMTICLLIPCFSMVSFAADGKIMFTDPTCKTGETVDVKVVVERGATGSLGKIELTMTYDSQKLKFKSGDGVTESEIGVITYQGDATRDAGRRKEFVIKFDALQTGTAEIKIQSATIKDASGNTKNYTKGSSKVTISQGEVTVTPPTSTDAIVDVDGKDYRFANAIPENEIPEGYVAATLNYDEADYNVVYNETTGLYLAYLIGEDNAGDLFLYVEENATFVPYESIAISDKVTIVLLSEVEDVVMPKEYKETKVIVNDFEFPAWQNEDAPEFCIIYAMGSNGVKSLYQLDNTEGTYQRFTAPEIVPEEKETWITKLSDVMVKHMDKVILGTGFGFLLFVLIIVILSIKLYNRNVELDLCYDELDAKDAAVGRDDDEDDDDYDSEEDATDERPSAMEMLVQEGMREVFPEETTEETEHEPEVELPEKAEAPEIESKEESIQEVMEENSEKKEEVEETVATLSEALEQQKSEEKQESSLFDDDDEILLEDFSVDFIDLEDDDE